ncbi:insulinase family protein [Arenibacter sp. M-2]|uniref:M16 family metallopeptidase n=1 Tax=Arenibacter sp. M-2 TaxID=3053612 RepID=UPI00257083B6|nr:M16 family metallopeptidase [Arenibacter sp. M-2]MDL5513758.1 insulinase family protein [Arenibacter sp. M-2]|tara:strand:- start:4408 stop:7212 length:2805 start_codon:yes stop_codon:yes gene_type:complete
MKYSITYLLILGLYLSVPAQNLDLGSPLPVDLSIRKGMLSNGMTYYIKSTDVTKGVASYYIIQNVGSVLENDDQQGLAHFLEHMAFNGTQNFEGKGVLNTMQRHGLVFGRDINAYTSFDETVYNINNIPTTPELIDTGLLILHDWSNFLLLTDEEIDAERGVIKEEWRTRQSGGMRVLKQSLPTVFNNTKYAERMPIGSMDIIDNFEYQTLRDFYHDWYRTDLQAIAIIGDVDVNLIESKIKALFSNIEAVESPKDRFNVDIPDNEELLYNMAMDDEVTTSSISFGIRHPKSLKDQTVADFKESLHNGMIMGMLSKRINEISRKPEAAFLGARISYDDHSRTSKAFNVSISPKPDQQHQAFKSVLGEIVRAVKFGFAEAEIERTITEFKNFYENQIIKEDDKSHGSIVSTIQNNYLNNTTITNIAEEYEIAKSIFNSLHAKELHEAIKKIYKDNNRFLLVTGVKGKKNMSREEALEIIKGVENDDTLVAYTDDFSGKTLVSGLNIVPGGIVSEKEDSLGATTFTLSNGVKVHYKFADKNKNDVKLNAISYGGTSLLQDGELPSANLLGNVIQFSGLGEYSSTDLPKVLAGKTASASVGLYDLTENISGSSVSKDVETMLQMVYLRFVRPRFDLDGYNVIMQNVRNYQVRRSEILGEKMADSTTVTLYGRNHPKYRLFDDAYINDISFDKIKSIYNRRFGNAADFEFFIVGDVKKENLRPLLENYIASIPTTSERELWKDNSVSWLNDTIEKEIYLKMEDPKSSVRIAYKNNFRYSLKNAMIARVLGDILTLRYTDTLREEEGGTYGARANASLSKRPVQQASISVNFDCNPDKVSTLTAIVHEEIEKIANGDIKQLDLDKTLTNYIKERKQEKDYNDFDMNLLTTFYREGYDMDHPGNFEDIVNSISRKDVQKFTKKLLKKAQSYSIVFKPLKS